MNHVKNASALSALSWESIRHVSTKARKGFSRKVQGESESKAKKQHDLFPTQFRKRTQDQTEQGAEKTNKTRIRRDSSAKRAEVANFKDSTREFKVTRMAMTIPILLESPEIVCINKPPAILSQPGLPGEGTILELLRFQRRDMQLQTVNRLDKNTSGAMVLGRTESAIRELNRLFKESKVEKNVFPNGVLLMKYLALLKPQPGSPLYAPDITACRHLTFQEDTLGVLTKKTIHEVGQLTIQQKERTEGHILTYYPDEVASITHFRVLRRLDARDKVFILFTPLTGKKHQLRLHSAFLLGAPIIGDHRYGYPQDDGGIYSSREEDKVYKDGYALHCYRIAAESSIRFDVTAEFPGGRWGEVWDDVREELTRDEFEENVRTISKEAAGVFSQKEIQRFMKDPKIWAKGIRGPLVKGVSY